MFGSFKPLKIISKPPKVMRKDTVTTENEQKINSVTIKVSGKIKSSN